MLAPSSPPAVGDPPAASLAQSVRLRALRTAPPTLLARVRWVFVLFMLLTILVTVVLMCLVQGVDWGVRRAALAACAALAAWWVWGYRRGGFSWAGDAAEGVALMIMSMGMGDPLAPVFVLYFGLGYRALYGGLPRLVGLTLIYLVAHLGAVVLAGVDSSASLLSVTVLTQVPGFALTAGFMRVLYHVLLVHEQVVARERALAQELRTSEQRYRHLVVTAERQAQELVLLAHIQTTIARELDVAGLLRTLVELIAHTFGYPLVSLYLRDGEVLRLQHHVGYAHVVPEIPLTAGIIGRVVRSGHAVLVPDVHADPTFIAAIDGIVSEVCVPLLDQLHVVGVLNVETTDVHLGKADLRLITAVGAHAGIALERARMYAAVRSSEHQYRAVVNSVKEVIFQTDARGHWTLLNPAWNDITGFPVDASLGTSWLTYVHPDDRHELAEHVSAVLTGQAVGSQELRCVTHAGGVRWLEVAARPLRDAAGTVIGTSGTLTDITERRELAEVLRHQAFHDALTGLPNRARLSHYLAQVLTRPGQDRLPVAVLFLDLDGFKSINDSLGHAAGDHLLHAVAARLTACVRAEDMVARLGGDEFVVLLAAVADAGAAMDLAQRMIAAVEAPVVVAGHEVRISTSIGIVLSTAGQASPDAVLQLADRAMYQAKRAGKGRYVVCETTLHNDARMQPSATDSVPLR